METNKGTTEAIDQKVEKMKQGKTTKSGPGEEPPDWRREKGVLNVTLREPELDHRGPDKKTDAL